MWWGDRSVNHADDQKEPDMQIGYPTDVKHVAHIGWDGPSANNTPSWVYPIHLHASSVSTISSLLLSKNRLITCRCCQLASLTPRLGINHASVHVTMVVMIIWFMQMREFESTPEVSSRSLDSFGEAKLTSEGLYLLLKSSLYTWLLIYCNFWST